MNLILVLSVILGIALSFYTSGKDKQSIHGTIKITGKHKTEYSALAKISIQESIAIASKASSGQIIEAALEQEDGFLIYEIESIMANHTREEIIIDAGDGHILDVRKNNQSNDN